MQRGHFRELAPRENESVENPDAEPVPPCAAAKPAIIIHGKRIGTTVTVCTDDHCPVHDPRAASRTPTKPSFVDPVDPAREMTEEQQQEEQERNRQRTESRAEEERQAEERWQELERRKEAIETERAQRKEIEDARQATFDRILANAPTTFTAAQLRLVLRALVSGDEYIFGELASEFADADTTDEPTDALLLSVIDGVADDKLTAFALRLALTQHKAIPGEDQIDFLAEAELAFAPPQPAKAARQKKAKAPTPIKSSTPKKKTNKKRIAA